MNRLALLKSQIAGNTYTKIQVSTKGTIGMIHLNSHKDLNCLSNIMMKEIVSAINQFNISNQIKVIVIFSTHKKIFCAGADIKSFQIKNYQEYLKHQIFNIIQQCFDNLKIPIIAAIDGMALGGGFQLALLCDVIVGSENASFGFPQINLGIIPGMGGTQRLTKIVGEKIAMKWILTGQSFKAQKAYEYGIVAQLFKSETFSKDVLELAEKVGSKSISSLIVGKRAIKQALDTTLTQGLKFQRSTFYPLMVTKGAKQGITAFIQKRKPNFTGI